MYICLPLKISRCCGGGTPDCSSTFSFMRVIYKKGKKNRVIGMFSQFWKWKRYRLEYVDVGRVARTSQKIVSTTYLVIGVDIELDLCME